MAGKGKDKRVDDDASAPATGRPENPGGEHEPMNGKTETGGRRVDPPGFWRATAPRRLSSSRLPSFPSCSRSRSGSPETGSGASSSASGCHRSAPPARCSWWADAMNDPNLFAAGLGITFLFLGGVYIVVRERFLHGGEDDDEE